MVAYLAVSDCAFWMSASYPAAVSAFSKAGRSPGSQRVPLSASGRITQARPAVASTVSSVDEPAVVCEGVVVSAAQPVRASAAAAASAENENIEDFFMICSVLSLDVNTRE